jgi:tetratricopeptide (TPR) repeat protein
MWTVWCGGEPWRVWAGLTLIVLRRVGGWAMDEQRVQAYVALIERLFACPGGQEEAVLEQHSDLVDGGLVQVMGALVAQLRQQGQGQQADWLENLAGQVTQAMGMGGAAPPGGGELPGDLNAIVQELRQPVRDVRQMGRRLDLCRRALALVPRQGNEQLWAALQVELGNSLVFNQLGDLGLHLEEALMAYEQALQVITRKAMPFAWATVMSSLAVVYRQRIRGDRAKNLEAAIVACEKSLQVMRREDNPTEWATVIHNLATTYLHRIQGDRAQDLEKAISLYKKSLQIRTRSNRP